MSEVLSFQRARKPAEQQLRREAILAAAAALFDAEGPQGAGLNAIAAKAGFTKSNVYRYFESREEVLMSLFLAELESFVADLEGRAAFEDPEALVLAMVDVQRRPAPWRKHDFQHRVRPAALLAAHLALHGYAGVPDRAGAGGDEQQFSCLAH